MEVCGVLVGQSRCFVLRWLRAIQLVLVELKVSAEVSAAVSAGFIFGSSWAQGSASIDLTASRAAEYTTEVVTSMSISRSMTQTISFDEAGQLWQWVYLVRDAGREAGRRSHAAPLDTLPTRRSSMGRVRFEPLLARHAPECMRLSTASAAFSPTPLLLWTLARERLG